jgi:hypothetical protein
MPRRKTIAVSERVQAWSAPNFVVRGKDGKLYLAVAVLEYDEKKAEGRGQAAGVKRVQEMFDRGLRSSPLVACQIDQSGEVSMQSEPPGVQTGPGPLPGPGSIGGKPGKPRGGRPGGR